MQPEFDFENPAPPSNELAALKGLAEMQIFWESEVTMLEEKLKEAKSNLHEIRTKKLPEFMAELGMDSMSFDGYSVKITDFVSGSIPKDPERKNKAIDWLSSHDASGIVKTQIRIEFPRGEKEDADRLEKSLRKAGYDPALEETVHPQTLQAFARERLEGGEEIDPEVLGLYIGKVSKISVPRK